MSLATKQHTSSMYPKMKRPSPLVQLIHGAKIGNYYEVWRAIVVRGLAVDTQEEETANTPLCYAAMHGHTEVLRFLLAQGAKVNGENRDGATALMRAALANEVESCRILLSNNASLKCRDRYGRTALMYAAMNGSLGAVEVLLQHRASKSARDQSCMSAYDWAELRNRRDLLPILTITPSKSWTCSLRAMVPGGHVFKRHPTPLPDQFVVPPRSPSFQHRTGVRSKLPPVSDCMIAAAAASGDAGVSSLEEEDGSLPPSSYPVPVPPSAPPPLPESSRSSFHSSARDSVVVAPPALPPPAIDVSSPSSSVTAPELSRHARLPERKLTLMEPDAASSTCSSEGVREEAPVTNVLI